MFHIDQQVQLEAEPLDNFVDLAVVVRVFLTTAGCLRQALFFFDFGTRPLFATSVERCGVSCRVASQIRHRFAQLLDHRIEDLMQERQVCLLS
ncbi:MAG: hypothetical protein H6823_21000 [Planctomycetaceae bacterium]|nr:hypothetical protein [Planctomycetaceae bacterium]